jgi:hypothetical protein
VLGVSPWAGTFEGRGGGGGTEREGGGGIVPAGRGGGGGGTRFGPGVLSVAWAKVAGLGGGGGGIPDALGRDSANEDVNG